MSIHFRILARNVLHGLSLHLLGGVHIPGYWRSNRPSEHAGVGRTRLLQYRRWIAAELLLPLEGEWEGRVK